MVKVRERQTETERTNRERVRGAEGERVTQRGRGRESGERQRNIGRETEMLFPWKCLHDACALPDDHDMATQTREAAKRRPGLRAPP